MKLLPVRVMWVSVSYSQVPVLSSHKIFTMNAGVFVCQRTSNYKSQVERKDVALYLSKVPNVKQVKGLKQVTPFEIKFCHADS